MLEVDIELKTDRYPLRIERKKKCAEFVVEGTRQDGPPEGRQRYEMLITILYGPTKFNSWLEIAYITS
jgi:hypothetical protein